MLIKVVAILAGITVVLAGCSERTHYGQEDVLLKIGPWQLTVADYEYISNSTSYNALTPAQQQARLMEEGRILAFAMDHRYDTLSTIHCQLDHALQYQVSSVDGYVWNKNVKPLLKVSDEAIGAAHAMRTQEYKLETIYFAREALLKKYYTAAQPINSARDFYALQQTIKPEPGVNLYNGFMRYPFFPLGVYLPALSQATPGAVWGPVETLSGYYIVHLADKQPLAPVSIEQEKPRIGQELLLALKEKMIWESQQEVLNDTRPKFYENNLIEIAAKADTIQRTWPGADPDQVLMEYDFNGARHNYTLSHLKEFIQCAPLFTGSLANPGDIKQMLHSWLIGIHLFQQAQQLDIENDTAYRQFRKRYQQNLFISHYKKQNSTRSLEKDYPVAVDHLEAYRNQKNTINR